MNIQAVAVRARWLGSPQQSLSALISIIALLIGHVALQDLVQQTGQTVVINGNGFRRDLRLVNQLVTKLFPKAVGPFSSYLGSPFIGTNVRPFAIPPLHLIPRQRKRIEKRAMAKVSRPCAVSKATFISPNLSRIIETVFRDARQLRNLHGTFRPSP